MFKCTCFHVQRYFYWVFQNHTNNLTFRLYIDIPKCSLIYFPSFLHDIEENRAIQHSDFGGICFIDFHRIMDWNIWGWASRCHRYRLMNGDAEVTWHRQKGREAFLFGTIKMLLELHTHPAPIHGLHFFMRWGIFYREQMSSIKGQTSCD